MNLLITTACNLDCPYCFAGSLRDGSRNKEMSLPELERVLLSMDPAVDTARLMGGEPTLHSSYLEILQMLAAGGFKVVVFTNGTLEILHRTAPWLPDRVLMNLNGWSFYAPSQQKRIRENLQALRGRVELGYTASQPDFDLGWHRRLILVEGLQPVVRLGLAQPVLGGDNVYLADADLPAAHACAVRWAEQLAQDGIRLSLDCGFMRCHFDDAEIETLIRSGTAPRFACSPTVDVGPGLEAWRCYAFTNREEVDWQSLKDQSACQECFIELEMNLRQDCLLCQHFTSGWCQGGCLARALMQETQTLK